LNYYQVRTSSASSSGTNRFARATLADLTNYPKYKEKVQSVVLKRQAIESDYTMPKFKAEGNKKLPDIIRSNNFGGNKILLCSTKAKLLVEESKTTKVQTFPFEMKHNKSSKEYFFIYFQDKIRTIDFDQSTFFINRAESTSLGNEKVILDENKIKDYNEFLFHSSNPEYGIRIKKLKLIQDIGFDLFHFDFGIACNEHFMQKCKHFNITGLKFNKFPLKKLI